MSPLLVAGVLGPLLALFLWRLSWRSKVSLPPGPKPLPFVGNLKDLASKELWLPATVWAREIGDVCFLHVFGYSVVFLSSREAAFELLDKRGAIYSDKPELIMAGELCGCQNMLPFTSHGDRFKRQRRLMQQTLGPRSIPAYHSFLEAQTQIFIKRLLQDPSGYMNHVRNYSGGSMLSVIYGYQPATNDDHFLRLAEDYMDIMSNRIAAGPGIWPVDVFPVLKYLPAWFPGAAFKRDAVKWKAKLYELIEQPFQFAKSNLSNGVPSFCSSLLGNDVKLTIELEDDIKWTANTMYLASADTTIATICHFILAMLHYPDVLRKAQKEINEVVGSSRLPSLNDRNSLPYIDCVLKETWRWGVPVPLGLPHCLTVDDVYCGMHIPKGTIVMANIWAMLHNEALYPNPDVFDPERFMQDTDPETKRHMDPRNYVFGFGRRRCPGSDLAETSIWLLIATMIATLDISKATDASGNVLEPRVEFNNRVFRTPSFFKFSVKERVEKA